MEAMDHSEVREILEDAAIEPDGLERLMAGDTPTASIVAGHVAGCPDCAEELARLHRSVGVIRPVVRTVSPPELRERTLACVATVGRPRGAAVEAPSIVDAGPVRPHATDPHGPEAAPATAIVVPPRRLRSGPARLGWLAGVAAALIVAVSGTAVFVSSNRDGATRTLTAEVEALGDVTRSTLRVDGQPDVTRVALASAPNAGGSAAAGTLIFSPGSTELVVVADGLNPPAAGREYRCWVEVNGARAQIGKMFFGGDIAYWVGKVPEVGGLAPGARFGVTLVDIAGAGRPSEDVLVSAG